MIKTIVFRIKLTAVLASVLFTVDLIGQSYKGDITILSPSLEQSGDSVSVNMDIRLSDVRVRSKVSLELVPYLASATHEYILPEITIKGRTVYMAWERELAMTGHSRESYDEALTVRGYKTDTVINYRYTFPYEAWMTDAVLNLSEHDSCCGESVRTGFTNLVSRQQIPYTPLLIYAMPEVCESEQQEKLVECRLDFVVNQTDIDPLYMNNPSELARIRDIIDKLESDPAINITAIEIVGKASPEGNAAANQRLSEGRTLSMRNYLSSLYDFPENIFRLTFGGENWDGLISELRHNPIDRYEELLNIIETTPPDQTRKNQIMSLHGGEPYRYMLRNIYPKLRTAICKIGYRIKGLEPSDAVEVYHTRPQDLKINEFYMVAGTMAEGSPEFVDVFEAALRVYPDDEIANLNAAVAALQEKDIQSAEIHLEKVVVNRSLPEYHNAMGVLLLLQSDIAGARVHFEQAACNLKAAGENLKMISVPGLANNISM